MTSVTCVEDNADGQVNPASPLTGNGGFEIITVPVAPGDQWTCTETNTHKGTITVAKHLVPSTDPGLFDLYVDGAHVSRRRRRRHHRADHRATPATTTSTSTRARAARSRTTSPRSRCVEDNADGHVNPASPLNGNGGFEIITVPVAPGDQWTCTETNTRATATLTVVKHVVNDNGGGATASQWTMAVTGGTPSPGSFAGSEAGTAVTVLANAGYSRRGVRRAGRVRGQLVEQAARASVASPRRIGNLHADQRRPPRHADRRSSTSSTTTAAARRQANGR